MLAINSNFDAGNIICKDLDDAQNIRLEIKKDNASDFYQWFYFCLTGARDQDCLLHFENAVGAAYTEGWKDYRAVASYDREHWFRVDTSFDNKTLVINHRPEFDQVYYAYFAPYSMERHADLVAAAACAPGVRTEVLGSTLDGQNLDLLVVGESGHDRKPLWVIARQHPGETMAEWWIEGFLERLLDEYDPVARQLLQKAVFYIVPNMNPDGSRRGHLRTNATGINLNREWNDSSAERSPEVFYVDKKMRQTGLRFCLDVHGDEGLPYNFIAGSEGIPSWTTDRQELLDSYRHELASINPDFQTRYGYPLSKPGKGNMAMCTNHIAESFNCLAMTLEMPFKDTADTPDNTVGWSPERCQRLGASNLDVIHRLLDRF